MMKEKNLLNNAFFSFIKTFTSLLFPVITYMYVSRVFGVNNYGKINFSKSFIEYTALFSMLGITQYGIREAAKLRDNKEKLSLFVHEILIINAISMIISYVALFLLVFNNSHLASYKTLILIYSVEIVLRVLGVEWLYTALEEYRYIALRTFCLQIVSFMAVIAFVKKKEDILIYAVIQILASSGNNLFNFFHLRKYIVFTRIKYKQVVRHFIPIMVLFFMTLFINVFRHLDTLMLGFMKDDRTVGLYAAGDKMSTMFVGVIGSFITVLLPRVSYYVKNDENERIRKISIYASDILLLIAIPISIGIVFFAREIIQIFSGVQYVDAIRTTQILALRVLLSPINGLFVLNLFIPTGMENRSVLITGVAALMDLGINALLIPNYAQNGAAIATVLAELAETIIILCCINRFLSVNHFLRQALKYFLVSLVIPVLYCIFRFVKNNYVHMVLVALLSVVMYLSILLITKDKYITNFVGIIKKTN